MRNEITQEFLQAQGFSKTFLNRFWSKANKDGAVQPHTPELGKCWEWAGCLIPNGYAIISKNGRLGGVLYVHRVSWFLHHGEVGDLFVLHKCDNRRCVNPDHLFLGTHMDNTMDAMRKGRLVKPPRHVGEQCNSAKLTMQKAEQIRALYATGDYSQEELGAQFGVDQTIVSDVVRFETWKP